MNTTSVSSPGWLHRLDLAGSVLSTLCAIHCLAMPLVAVALPLCGLAILGTREWERGTSTAMVALAAVCLWQGCRRHRRWWLLALLAAGASAVLGAQFLWAKDACCATRADWTEAAFMFAGGLTIAVAHGLNLHYRRKCGCRLCPGAIIDPARDERPQAFSHSQTDTINPPSSTGRDRHNVLRGRDAIGLPPDNPDDLRVEPPDVRTSAREHELKNVRLRPACIGSDSFRQPGSRVLPRRLHFRDEDVRRADNRRAPDVSPPDVRNPARVGECVSDAQEFSYLTPTKT